MPLPAAAHHQGDALEVGSHQAALSRTLVEA
jgi:hypothetical protein